MYSKHGNACTTVRPVVSAVSWKVGMQKCSMQITSKVSEVIWMSPWRLGTVRWDSYVHLLLYDTHELIKNSLRPSEIALKSKDFRRFQRVFAQIRWIFSFLLDFDMSHRNKEAFYKVTIPIYLQYFGISLDKRILCEHEPKLFIYSVYNLLSGILYCKNSTNRLWNIEEKALPLQSI